jgi:hypothetical protein
MDILELVRAQVETLSEGQHSVGLKSVVRHIDAAHRHLARGQDQQDDSAFTDAIYRTNQAFEGSIKEAYRVLAGKDPQKTTPYNIETYLQKNGLFRQRVLSQFANYRTEWRNPSTHDYNLDFDEDEAFLAIVSVSAFAKLLIDQISEKLTFIAVKEDVQSQNITMGEHSILHHNLMDRVVDAFLKFLREYVPRQAEDIIHTEAQFLGALGGFLSSFDGDISVLTYQRTNLPNGRFVETDMTLMYGDETIIVELKRGASGFVRETGLRILDAYVSNTDVSGGILLIYQDRVGAYQVETHETRAGKAIKIIRPA